MNKILESRDLTQLIQDFRNSAGSFNSFLIGMNQREKILFRGWLHSLREKAHSPLLGENLILS